MSLPLVLTAIAGYLVWKSPQAQSAVRPLMSDWNRFDERFKYHASVNGIGDMGGIPGWQVLKAIALNESDLGRDPLSQGQWSRDGKSRGLMQLTLPTANDFESVSPTDLDNPETSIRIAAKFLAQLWIQQGRTLEYTVKGYNEGGGNALKEQRGQIAGFAGEYWDRFQRNLETVQSNEEG